MWSELFQSPALWFTVPALLGTGVFLLKLSMVLIGVDHHGDGDVSGAGDGHGDGHHDADPTGGFKLVSVQAAFGFIMGFGWSGLACLKSFEWSPAMSVVGGLVGGLGFGFIVSLMLNATRKMESSGNLMMTSVVGHEGSVYANVPAKGEGRGQVRIVAGTRERIVTATSDGPAVNTGARVRIVHANADNSIIVTPV
jgi:hypothetical protein